MAGVWKRTYGDRCGIARALDLVGERWALLVVRELLLGPKRFSDLRASLGRVSADVLAQRLRELEQAGVITRAKLPPPSSARVYALTAWGAELEPIVLGLGRWGSRAPFPQEGEAFGPDSAMLALKTLFDGAAADGVTGTLAVRLDENPYLVRVAQGQLTVTRAEPEAPDAELATDPATLAAVLWHGRDREQAIADGTLRISGDRACAERILALFPLPPTAEGAG
jgi:DNA-binding HxlR family transcriptional regulator